MIRIDFVKPIEIEQEGMLQELTFIECTGFKSANSHSMFIFIRPGLSIVEPFNNIKHISEL